MILHHGVNLPTARYIRRVGLFTPPEKFVRGHDISGKRFYKN